MLSPRLGHGKIDLGSDHNNRKHNRRFKCSRCDRPAFHLKADLKRHLATTHAKDLDQKPLKVFRCPNIGCSIPEKEFYRRDNFRRHVKSCSKGKEKDKAR
jgi:uncharacterized Zn-finger protein